MKRKPLNAPGKDRRTLVTRTWIAAILLVVTAIIVLPYIWMLSNSFKSTHEILTNSAHFLPQSPTTAGYERVLTESPFFLWLRNSLFVTIINTVIVLFTSTLIGYVFSKYRFRGKSVLFMVMLATMMIPAQTIMIPQFILIDTIGLYDSVWALIIPAFINVFGIYLCKQFCDEIPKELMESAKLDGAGDFRIYYKIVIPQIRPAIGALAIFSFLEYWNDYLNPLIFLSSQDKMTLPLALSFFSTQHNRDIGATMAVAALVMIPVTIVFLIFQKHFIKGISMTGMK
jgi:ABC-type glycerol-3-phosphate transport system permease component